MHFFEHFVVKRKLKKLKLLFYLLIIFLSGQCEIFIHLQSTACKKYIISKMTIETIFFFSESSILHCFIHLYPKKRGFWFGY